MLKVNRGISPRETKSIKSVHEPRLGYMLPGKIHTWMLRVV